MRVLLLNQYYPPDTSATARMAQTVVQALATRHDVTVLCGRPSYDPTERHSWTLYQTENTTLAKIVRVGSTDYPRIRMKRRVLNYLSYVALSVPRAIFIPCDVVLAMTDPPFQGIVGAFVAFLKRKPFFYNIRDLYPDMAVAGSILEAGLLSRLWEKLHRWALRRATRVIALGEDMRARIIAKGVAPERVVVVRDGTDILPPGVSTPVDPHVVHAIRGDFRFVLVHAGNLGFYGAWNTLLAAARELSADNIGFVFVGDGAQRAQMEAAAAGSPNVRFLPFFPAGKIPSVLAAADVHVVTVKRGLEGVVVPSKMYGILAAGKPILAVAPSESDPAALCVQFGFGVSVDPDNPQQLAALVRELATNPSTLQSMGALALAAAPTYDRAAELYKFLQILEASLNAA